MPGTGLSNPAYTGNPFRPDKILYHECQLEHWAATGTTHPITVQVDPYDGPCNHKCPECVAGFNGFTGATMKEEEYRLILRDLQSMGVKAVTLSGGSEPTLHPGLPKMIFEAKRAGLDVAVVTNGARVTQSLSDAIAQCCTWVRVSLDAATPSLFQVTHGVTERGFRRVIQGIKRLVESKRKYRGVVSIGTAFLTAPDYRFICEMESFVELSQSLGVDYAQFRPMLRQPRGREKDWTLNALHSQVLETIVHCLRMSSPPDFSVFWSEHKYSSIQSGQLRPYSQCLGASFVPAISAAGRVAVCCHHLDDPQYELGNVHTKSFRDIWESETSRCVFERIDLCHCPHLCRASSFNEILPEIMNRGYEQVRESHECIPWLPGDHLNFL